MPAARPTRASEAVKAWVNEPGHTQAKLAEIVSRRVLRPVCQATISAIARGVSQPRADILGALAAELGIELSWWSAPAVAVPAAASDADDDLPRTG